MVKPSTFWIQKLFQNPQLEKPLLGPVPLPMVNVALAVPKQLSRNTAMHAAMQVVQIFEVCLFYHFLNQELFDAWSFLQTCPLCESIKQMFNRILSLQASTGFGKKPHKKDITLLKNCTNERNSCISIAYPTIITLLLRTRCKSFITPTLRNSAMLPSYTVSLAQPPIRTSPI